MNNTASIYFKPLSEHDLALLLNWFEQPHVSKWWPVLDKNETIAHFTARIRSSDTRGFIAYLDNKPIGYFQYYSADPSIDKNKWLPPLPALTIGTDQFIGDPDYIGKGYGTMVLKAFINYLFENNRSLTTIIVDPEPENYGAIKCYEKVGFVKIGILKEGSALLMRYDKSIS